MNLLHSIFLTIVLVLTAYFILAMCTGLLARYECWRGRGQVWWTDEDRRCLKVFAVGALLCTAALWALLETV